MIDRNKIASIIREAIEFKDFGKPALDGSWKKRTMKQVDNLEEACRIAANAILSHLSSSSGWQPIETAPKDANDILIIDMLADIPGADIAFWDGMCWAAGCRSDPTGGFFVPTHWQPLPDPPRH